MAPIFKNVSLLLCMLHSRHHILLSQCRNVLERCKIQSYSWHDFLPLDWETKRHVRRNGQLKLKWKPKFQMAESLKGVSDFAGFFSYIRIRKKSELIVCRNMSKPNFIPCLQYRPNILSFFNSPFVPAPLPPRPPPPTIYAIFGRNFIRTFSAPTKSYC